MRTSDGLNRLIQTSYADGRETQFEYGNDGRLSRVIDGEENATEYLYDALGRLVLTIAADGGTTERRYDAAGNLLALIDPVGNVTSWLYDRTYRVVAEIDPLGETESVSYDLAGRPLIVTDRLGRQKVYTYTDGGRIASEAWYDDEENLIDTLSYIYNDDGRLYTASNAAGTYTFTYDDLGRVATVQDINGITLTYGWDEVDDLVTLSDSEGGVITSEYDEAHRLIERSQSGTGVESISIQIDYDTEGRRGELRRYSDATGTTLISSTEYGYDNAGNLTSLIHKDDVGDPLVTYSNTFDDNNRITSETRNSVTVNYEYDEVNQVVDDDTNEYSYDLNGNRTMTGYSTGTGNRIETDGTWTYEYDLEGNLVKKSMGEEDETWEYGYDNDNRLLWAEKALTDGGIVRLRVEYVYDVFGNRVSQTVDSFDAEGDPLDSETSRYAFIGQQVWADLDENGDIVTRYLLGDAFGERFARSGDSETYWLLTDRLGSTREILDETGDIVDEISYDAFGVVIAETAPALSGDYLYTGLRWFAATELYGTPNRDYDPTIAKWLQTDSIGFNGGLMNLYGYVGNNGTNLTDLSGLQQAEKPKPGQQSINRWTDTEIVHQTIKAELVGNELRLYVLRWTRFRVYTVLQVWGENKTIRQEIDSRQNEIVAFQKEKQAHDDRTKQLRLTSSIMSATAASLSGVASVMWCSPLTAPAASVVNAHAAFLTGLSGTLLGIAASHEAKSKMLADQIAILRDKVVRLELSLMEWQDLGQRKYSEPSKWEVSASVEPITIEITPDDARRVRGLKGPALAKALEKYTKGTRLNIVSSLPK